MGNQQHSTDENDNTNEDSGSLSRRGTFGLLGLTGLGALAGRASASNDRNPVEDGFAPWRHWSSDVNANGNDLYNLGALELEGTDAISDFAGDGLSIDDGVLTAAGGGAGDETVINNVRYVDVAEGAAAVQDAVDEADAEGHNKVVVYGDEGEWNQTIYLPSEFTLEFRDGVTVTSTMTEEDTELFEGGAALITNNDHENGNHDITVRGGHIDFDGVEGEVDTLPRWGPVWLHTVENALFDSITVENVDWRYGMVFTDCTRSKMIDCTARNIGYDGITLRGTCRHVDVIRCGTYGTVHGPGVQAAPKKGGGGTGGHNLNFIDCRMDEHLAIHGVRGGITDVGVHGCSVRRIGIIQEIDGFRVSDCDVDTIAFSALGGETRNGRIDGCTMGPRYTDHDAQIDAAIALWETGGGLIENISFSNCTARGHSKFVEMRLTNESGNARYIDFSNCAYDSAGADDPTAFIDHTPDGEWESVGTLSNVRLHGCKIWNLDTAINGPVESLRVRTTEFHNVDQLDNGEVTDLETHQNDWW